MDSQRDAASSWLLAVLSNGPVRSRAIESASEMKGHAWRTVLRAKADNRIVTERIGGGQGSYWRWRLNDSEQATKGAVEEMVAARTIHISGFRGTSVQVSLDGLGVDSGYQRGEVPTHINRMAKDFDADAFGAIIVSRRPSGDMVIIDGQQRVAAARIAGVDSVPAMVYPVATREEEARLFDAINSKRKQPTAVERFKASVCAGIQPETDIIQWCCDNGFEITANSRYTRDDEGTISFISSLVKKWKTSPETTKAAILTQRLIGGNMHGVIFSGIWCLLRNGINIEEYIEKIRVSGGREAILAQFNLDKRSTYGHAGPVCAGAILAIINRKKRNRIRMGSPIDAAD